MEGDAKTPPKVRTRGGHRKLGVRRAPRVRILGFFCSRCSGSARESLSLSSPDPQRKSFTIRQTTNQIPTRPNRQTEFSSARRPRTATAHGDRARRLRARVPLRRRRRRTPAVYSPSLRARESRRFWTNSPGNLRLSGDSASLVPPPRPSLAPAFVVGPDAPVYVFSTYCPRAAACTGAHQQHYPPCGRSPAAPDSQPAAGQRSLDAPRMRRRPARPGGPRPAATRAQFLHFNQQPTP